MTELQIRAILAGVFFGVWPLLMNRSGLNGNVSAVVLGGVVCLMVLPLAYQSMSVASLMQVSWPFALLACVAAAIGNVAFNEGLAKSTPQDVSTFFELMIVVQIVIPAVYQIILRGGVSWSNLLGFVFAALAAHFLLK